MPLQQFRLDKSVEQTRGIFDKYIYAPDNGDTLSDITTNGYFDLSRFANEKDWPGSIIEVRAPDGYVVLLINEDGSTTVLLPGSSGGGGAPISDNTVEINSDYVRNSADKLIYTTGDVNLTMDSPSGMNADTLIVRCISGTCTFIPSTGTVETPSITTGASVTLVPRPSDNSWRTA